MQLNFDTCPHCGQRVLKGALRCPGCNKILQTPQEREVLLQKYKSSEKKFNIKKLLKFIIVLVVIGIIYLFFSDRIIQFIGSIFNK